MKQYMCAWSPLCLWCLICVLFFFLQEPGKEAKVLSILTLIHLWIAFKDLLLGQEVDREFQIWIPKTWYVASNPCAGIGGHVREYLCFLLENWTSTCFLLNLAIYMTWNRDCWSNVLDCSNHWDLPCSSLVSYAQTSCPCVFRWCIYLRVVKASVVLFSIVFCHFIILLSFLVWS